MGWNLCHWLESLGDGKESWGHGRESRCHGRESYDRISGSLSKMNLGELIKDGLAVESLWRGVVGEICSCEQFIACSRS